MSRGPVSTERKEASRISKDEWREYTQTVWSIANVRHAEHPAVFPPEIPRRLIKLFTFVDELVLDPFAGTGTTGVAALELDRRSVLVDQNPAYVELADNATSALGEEGRVHCRVGDSRDLSWLEDGSIQLVVTSPPYWNKADYDGGDADLGQIESYTDFLEALRPAFLECLRVLEPGRKLCVVTANVNQNTDHGLLTFPIATDLAVMLRDIGFVMNQRDHLEQAWNRRTVGLVWVAAPYLRKLPVPAQLPVQERPRVHPHLCQADAHA